MAALGLEERLSLLEAEVKQLKEERVSAEKQIPWWEQISGVFKDDPLFDEAERLGREWRDSQQIDYDGDDDVPA